jgi:hypothetical protein
VGQLVEDDGFDLFGRKLVDDCQRKEQHRFEVDYQGWATDLVADAQV